jgi:predicted Zn-dependent protease
MNQRRIGRNIGVRPSEASLLIVTILLLFQSISAAQNHSVYETDARPWNTSATLTSAKSEPFKTYHDGSIRNISAVGSRDIGCTRGLGDRYSLGAQDMGRSYAQQVENTSKLITDPVIAKYVNRIAQSLARNSDIQIQLTLKIIDRDEVNAFSLPGGLIYVHSGLILAADNEAELAGVVSHEIAHVAACHTAQEVAREEPTNLGSMPLILRLAVRQFSLNTIHVKPTRSFESEADSVGIEILYRAGYDPQALSAILEKVEAIDKQKPGSRTHAFESHSLTTDRIARTRQKINRLRLPAREYKVDTPDFHEIKERLSELDKPHN